MTSSSEKEDKNDNLNSRPRLYQIERIKNDCIIESSQFSPNTKRDIDSSIQKDPTAKIEIDKDKLFETFVLFQSLMNINNNSDIILKSNSSNNLKALFKDTSDNFSLKSKTNLKELPNTNGNGKGYLSQQEQNTTSPIQHTMSHNETNTNTIDRYYDDRPIKSTNGNFIELVEKHLAIDKPTESENKTKHKKKLNKARTDQQLKRAKLRQTMTADKEFYPSNTTVNNVNNIQKYQIQSLNQTTDSSQQRSEQCNNNYETPRRIITYIKLDQQPNSIRKSNTEVYPYMPLSSIKSQYVTNVSKEANNQTHVIQKQSIIEEKHQRKKSRNNNSNQEVVEKKEGEHNDNNYSYNNSHSSRNSSISSSSYINNHLVQDNTNGNSENEISPSKKEEESFQIITTLGNDDDENDNKRSKKSEDVFSIDEENNNQNSQANISIKNIINQKNNSAMDIEPLQCKNIPVSSKLFNPLSVQMSKDTIEMIIEKKRNQLLREMALFEEEKSKVELLKSNYEKLHLQFEKEINELALNKSKFTKWRDDEASKLKMKLMNQKQYKTIINDCQKENEGLKLNANNCITIINNLKNGLKEIEREKKEKEYMKQLNLTNYKTTACLTEPSMNYEQNKRSEMIHRRDMNNTYNNIQSSRMLTYNSIQSISNLSTSQNHDNSTISNEKHLNKRFNQASSSMKNTSTHLAQMDKFGFCIPEEYKNKTYKMIKKEMTQDGKEIRWYTNNKTEIIFPSGTKKEVYGDDYQIVYLHNGDIKQLFKSGKCIYYSKDKSIIQTSINNHYKDNSSKCHINIIDTAALNDTTDIN